MDTLRNMIIEQKVIDLITEHAEFKSVEYQPDDARDTSAISFFVGGTSEQIPEAKYEPGESVALPGTKEKERD